MLSRIILSSSRRWRRGTAMPLWKLRRWHTTSRLSASGARSTSFRPSEPRERVRAKALARARAATWGPSAQH